MLGLASLLAQIGGGLLGGAILVGVLRQLAPSGLRAYAAVAIVPVVVGALLAVPNLRLAIVEFVDRFQARHTFTPAEAEVRGGVAQRVDVEFLRWVRSRLAPGDTIRMVGPRPAGPVLRLGGNSAQDTAAYQWSLFQLAPHLAVDRWQDADWVVLYDRDPAGAYPAQLFDPPQAYAPRYLIARRRGAR